jgi:26S proteasome regulatory subunit N1
MMDGHLIYRPALVGLITFAIVAAHCKTYLLQDHPFLFYTLVPAFRSRCLTTVKPDEATQEVTLRIGAAVDVAGLPGTPNLVTGFQTMTSPVVLQAGQRIEIVDPEWEPLTDLPEGVVVVIPKADEEADGKDKPAAKPASAMERE